MERYYLFGLIFFNSQPKLQYTHRGRKGHYYLSLRGFCIFNPLGFRHADDEVNAAQGRFVVAGMWVLIDAKLVAARLICAHRICTHCSLFQAIIPPQSIG